MLPPTYWSIRPHLYAAAFILRRTKQLRYPLFSRVDLFNHSLCVQERHRITLTAAWCLLMCTATAVSIIKPLTNLNTYNVIHLGALTLSVCVLLIIMFTSMWMVRYIMPIDEVF